MTSATDAKPLRYHSLSILLHWTVVLGLVFMLASGLYMVNADISKADQYKLFQLHKAAGVVMLWALFVRICVRIFTTAPDLPSTLTNADKKKAKTGHLTLRGISQPVSFLLKDNGATLSANFSVNRLAHKIGFESDPDAEWVSKEIDMTLLLNK